MNTQQTQLYQRIQAFSLNDPHADLSFSQRLARDNGWTQQYTQRVIEEYKKFIFLAMVTMAALSLLVALIVGSVVPSITTAITEDPWISLLLTFLAFSALSFIVAVRLSFRKSYVYPGSKARVCLQTPGGRSIRTENLEFNR